MAEFDAGLDGLSGHARARLEGLKKALGSSAEGPKLFGVIGHLAGYGEGAGYGIRHCNPEIVKDECQTLRLLGMNGLVDERSEKLADAAGVGQEFRHVFWGGSGVGSPEGYFKKVPEEQRCPFDPKLRQAMQQSAQRAAAGFPVMHADQNWAIAWDEIGVAAKDHINTCPECAEHFREYLKGLKLEPAAFGKKSWDEVKPYPLWVIDPSGGKKGPALAPAPKAVGDALCYYYTFRFMTYATADLFPQAAQTLLKSGVRMYAMQGPTPSWGGHSLDWHEFYDDGANTALVWETSNRDARAWQWESYLADTMRGISQRHDLPIGCLVKPHRGAPAQRVLSAVTRGAKTFEWYTYGPDYAKGDSFSQSPELLEAVARADRFLARAEDVLYDAHWAGKPQVAFVTPRSSEIWGKTSPQGVANFEDAKWVYSALAHAHVPVDVLSEQQLAEGKLTGYRVIYVVGPNLQRAAAGQLKAWVESGGVLWTDAMGLGLDEANQPSVLSEMLPGNRVAQVWGAVESYHAVALQPFTGDAAPAGVTIAWGAETATITPAVGWVKCDAGNAQVLARFANGSPALLKRTVGKGSIVTAQTWAGLTYSARVRRTDFDMRSDFDPAAREMIAGAAIDRGVYRPVIPSDALVEAVLLENKGRKCVALMNWAYRAENGKGRATEALEPVENLTIRLPGLEKIKSVRSIVCGNLEVRVDKGEQTVMLPRLADIDALILE
ncbi:MAG TPA: beta-galactosidase trimerization domain-containing protein [Tepidisphaeraceae bacterium]|jgi:hypothetical protein|nr:beta-galactosidase trimerization domain-containing protein [Tepidisphaeraceae bacterium]